MSKDKYHITKKAICEATGLPERVAVGKIGTWINLEVKTGYRMDGKIILPQVRLYESGVANRIRILCPHCYTEMRFSVLQQHAETKACQRAKAKRDQHLKETQVDFVKTMQDTPKAGQMPDELADKLADDGPYGRII